MVSREENDLMTQTGPGAPAGALMRRYWQPAALAEELPVGGAPVPIRLLGEDLALYRDDRGRLGLIGLHCPHRGADLTYGRLEDGGLRCIYHGWLFDLSGACIEQPGEPAGSTFHERIRDVAYPCQEKGGIIFAYLGPGEPPLLPSYEFLTVPGEYRTVSKYFQECNYLQGNEGNHDPAHLSFLHRFFGAKDYHQTYIARDTAPTIETEDTDFGVYIYAIRKVGPDQNFVKVRSFILPNLTGVAGVGVDGYTVNWHVPIDDTYHWRYSITFRRDVPLDAETIRRERAEMTDGYRLVRSQANRYLQDRDEMKTRTFLGMGSSFVVHDKAATESAGAIQDRTQERLGYTDRGILGTRLALLRAIQDVQAGREPPHVVRDPALNHFEHIVVRDDVIPSSADWHRHWERERVGLR